MFPPIEGFLLLCFLSKIVSLKIYKNFCPSPELFFLFFFSFSSSYNFFLIFSDFSTKIDSGYHINFIWALICLNRTIILVENIIFQKKIDVKKIQFFVKISKIWTETWIFFLNIRMWSNELSFETLFLEITWQFSELFNLKNYLGSASDKNAIKYTKKDLRAHQNALYILNRCITTFHLSFQTHLYDLLPLILLILNILKLGHWQLLGAPWVTSKWREV